MNTDAIARACEIAGGQTALARQLGVHVSLPHQWIKGHRPIPAERCPEIEKATGGKVTCEELRPDVDWAYLRRTSERPQSAVACSRGPARRSVERRAKTDPAAPHTRASDFQPLPDTGELFDISLENLSNGR